MTEYQDTSLVYIDPQKNAVVGLVEWSKDGNVIPKEMPQEEVKAKDDEPKSKEAKAKKVFRRKPKRKFYPWCSYKTAKKVYRVEGKQKETESQKTLDDVMERALKEPFWDD